MRHRHGRITVVADHRQVNIRCRYIFDAVHRDWPRTSDRRRRIIIDGDQLRTIGGVTASVGRPIGTCDRLRTGHTVGYIPNMRHRYGRITVVANHRQINIRCWNIFDAIYRNGARASDRRGRIIIDGDQLRTIGGVAASVGRPVGTCDRLRASHII